MIYDETCDVTCDDDITPAEVIFCLAVFVLMLALIVVSIGIGVYLAV